MSDKIASLSEELSKLTILEVADLIKVLEEKWGVSAAPVAVAAAASSDSGDGEGSAAKTDFDVVLVNGKDANKIAVIKIVRELTGLGLKEAKELVDSGKEEVLKAGVPKEEAESIKAKLEEAGAKVALK